MLARLYDPRPRGDTGRRASTADVERNLPATGLTRGRPVVAQPAVRARDSAAAGAAPARVRPACRAGFGILRRDGGAASWARLRTSGRATASRSAQPAPRRRRRALVRRSRHGSYVDESLHWYRSTLAHTAPLVDGRSQPRVDGAARSVRGCRTPRDGCARAPSSRRDARCSAPSSSWTTISSIAWSGRATTRTSRDPVPRRARRLAMARRSPACPRRSREATVARTASRFSPTRCELVPDDCAGALASTQPAPGAHCAVGCQLVARLLVERGRPGAPGAHSQPLVLVRSAARRGAITSVWSWRGAVRSAELEAIDRRAAHRRLGARHRSTATAGRSIAHAGTPAPSCSVAACAAVTLRRRRPKARSAPTIAGDGRSPASLPIRLARCRALPPLRAAWEEAGDRPASCPRAVGNRLVVRVDVPRAERRFSPSTRRIRSTTIPPPFTATASSSTSSLARRLRVAARADPDSHHVARRTADGWSDTLPIDATWRRPPTDTRSPRR
jgi:hypothetical protein